MGLRMSSNTTIFILEKLLDTSMRLQALNACMCDECIVKIGNLYEFYSKETIYAVYIKMVYTDI